MNLHSKTNLLEVSSKEFRNKLKEEIEQYWNSQSRNQLHDQLCVHRNSLGKPSSPLAVSRCCDATSNLGELRASVRGLVDPFCHWMDRDYPVERRRRRLLCGRFLPGQPDVSLAVQGGRRQVRAS